MMLWPIYEHIVSWLTINPAKKLQSFFITLIVATIASKVTTLGVSKTAKKTIIMRRRTRFHV